MTKQQRRKDLESALSALDQVRLDLETLKDDEQDQFDNMPESAQESDRGAAMESRIESLEVAVEKVEAAMEAVQEAAEEPQ